MSVTAATGAATATHVELPPTKAQAGLDSVGAVAVPSIDGYAKQVKYYDNRVKCFSFFSFTCVVFKIGILVAEAFTPIWLIAGGVALVALGIFCFFHHLNNKKLEKAQEAFEKQIDQIISDDKGDLLSDMTARVLAKHSGIYRNFNLDVRTPGVRWARAVTYLTKKLGEENGNPHPIAAVQNPPPYLSYTTIMSLKADAASQVPFSNQEMWSYSKAEQIVNLLKPKKITTLLFKSPILDKYQDPEKEYQMDHEYDLALEVEGKTETERFLLGVSGAMTSAVKKKRS